MSEDEKRLDTAWRILCGVWMDSARWDLDADAGELRGEGRDGSWRSTLSVKDGVWTCVQYTRYMRTTATAASFDRALHLVSHFQTFLERRALGSETLLDEVKGEDGVYKRGDH